MRPGGPNPTLISLTLTLGPVCRKEASPERHRQPDGIPEAGRVPSEAEPDPACSSPHGTDLVPRLYPNCVLSANTTDSLDDTTPMLLPRGTSI